MKRLNRYVRLSIVMIAVGCFLCYYGWGDKLKATIDSVIEFIKEVI